MISLTPTPYPTLLSSRISSNHNRQICLVNTLTSCSCSNSPRPLQKLPIFKSIMCLSISSKESTYIHTNLSTSLSPTPSISHSIPLIILPTLTNHSAITKSLSLPEYLLVLSNLSPLILIFHIIFPIYFAPHHLLKLKLIQKFIIIWPLIISFMQVF